MILLKIWLTVQGISALLGIVFGFFDMCTSSGGIEQSSPDE